MKVLMISGDRKVLTPGTGAHARFELQRQAVERLTAVYFGRDALLDVFRVRGEFDVVTAQDPFWRGLAAWRVARRMGAKLNIQVHADLSAQSFLRRMIAQFVLRRADSVRVVSEKIMTQVIRVGIRAPVRVLPIFVDVRSFADLPHEAHPRFKKTILWLGRFEPEKDPMLALSVLEQVRNGGIDAGLIMLGAGSLEKELRDAVVGRSLSGWVEFVPWGDPRPHLRRADTVLCTSAHESWGASMVEALAAGVPVVAPDVGVAHEAGAHIADRAALAPAVIGVLREGARGRLLLSLFSAEEWARAWRASLV